MRIPTGIWLFRHGHTAMNSDDPSHDRIRSWRDVPLDAQGQRESRDEAAFIVRMLRPSRIYSSDLERTQTTANIAGRICHCPVMISSAFRPWGMGNLTGQPAEKVIPQLQAYINHPEVPLPGGESFDSFRSRFLDALRAIMVEQRQTDTNIVIITHFRNLKLAQAWIARGGKTNDLDAKVFAANDIPTGAALVITRGHGRWRIQPFEIKKVGVLCPPP